MIVWGTKLYGKVDEIEGVGFVATQFWHLMWIPLVPLDSYFVTHEERHRFEGASLGLSTKSVIVGYTRVFSVLFVLAGLGAINTLFNPTETADPEKIGSYWTMIALGAVSLPAFFATHARSVRFADAVVAGDLLKRLGLDEPSRPEEIHEPPRPDDSFGLDSEREAGSDSGLSAFNFDDFERDPLGVLSRSNGDGDLATK